MKQILFIDNNDTDVENTKRILGGLRDGADNPLYGFLLDAAGKNLGTTGILKPNQSRNIDNIRDAAVEIIHDKIDNFDILLIDGFLIGYKVEGYNPASLQIIKNIIDDLDPAFRNKIADKKIFLITGYGNRKRYITYSEIYADDTYKRHFTLLFRPAIFKEKDGKMDDCCFQDENQNPNTKKCSLWDTKKYSGKNGAHKCTKEECMLDIFQNSI